MAEEDYGVNWRLRSLEARMREVDELKLDAVVERVHNQGKEIVDVKHDILDFRKELSGLRKALLTFALSVAASSIIFAVGILELLKR